MRLQSEYLGKELYLWKQQFLLHHCSTNLFSLYKKERKKLDYR